MLKARYIFPLAIAGLSACSKATDVQQNRDFDVAITQTAPYATSLLVAPTELGADMPKLNQISSRKFALYFRSRTGCVVDTSRNIFPLGGERVPAGYIVPTICP